MRPPARLGACLLAVTLTTGLALPAPATAAPAGDPMPTGDGRPARTVTLITGDRFAVAPDGASVSRLPSPGREHAQFLTQRRQGHLEVLPTDAVELVNQGTLDPKLFDVTTLMDLGYDDTRTGLPLIVSYTGGDAGERTVRAGVATADAGVVHDLSSIDSLAIEQNTAQATGLWNALTTPIAGRAQSRGLKREISRVRLNGVRRPLLDRSTAQIGAPAAWTAGLTGEGVAVGVIDDGVDAAHPDLAGQVVAARDFTGTSLADDSGHATHVSSTIAGSGAGKYRGVAPGAKIYSGKVCGTITDPVTGLRRHTCPDAAIIAAMQWMAAEEHLRVVNVSLGGTNEPGLDAIEEAVQTLTAEHGTLFVIAAGNSGVNQPVSSPASAGSALAVGAVDRADKLAGFSSVGPRVERGVLKPEISAPGTDIVAARAYGRGTDAYVDMSGTSMATPHVSGAAAILAQQHPAWTAAELKAALIASAAPIAGTSIYSAGSGRLDVARATGQTVTTSPATVNVDDNEPAGQARKVTREITYRNAGSAPVTLALRLDAIRRGVRPVAAPDGMFELSTATLTVPAAGTATVTVTVDATRAAEPGLFGGDLTATGGGQVVRTPVGLDREPLFTLTIKHVNRAGQPTNRARVVVAGLTNEFYGRATELRTDSITTRVPAGRYLLSSTIMDNTPGRAVTALTDPDLTIEADTVIAMDARAGKPLSMTVEKPDAVQTSAFLNFFAEVGRDDATGVGLGIGGATFAEVFSAKLGSGSAKHVTSKLSASYARRAANGSTLNSPWTVSASVSVPGTVIDGYDRVVQDSELATVESSFAVSAAAKSTVTKFSAPVWPEFGQDDYSSGIEWALPGRRTDYYASAEGVTWNVELYHNVAGTFDWAPEIIAYLNSWSETGRSYQAGRRYTESWNKGVFGPAFPAPRPGQSGLNRTGNQFYLEPTLYSDDQGRLGSTTLAGSFLRLTRDGEVVYAGSSFGGYYDVAPGDAEYQLMINTGRKPLAGLATGNQITWTFRSAAPPADTGVKLPVSVMRFTPVLNETNKAAAGGWDLIPFTVQRQAGATPARTTGVEIQVSYDDGRTWGPAIVQRNGEYGTASVIRPAGMTSGYVSILSKATLSDGGTVDQKIVRAFGF